MFSHQSCMLVWFASEPTSNQANPLPALLTCTVMRLPAPPAVESQAVCWMQLMSLELLLRVLLALVLTRGRLELR